MRSAGRWGRVGNGAVVVVLLALTAAGCSREPSAKAEATAERGLRLGARDVARVERRDLSAGVQVSGTLRPATDIRITAPVPDLIESVLVKEGQAVKRGQVLARFRVEALAPAAASAEAQRKIAESDHRRMQNLLQEGAASRRDVENAEATLRAAEAAAAAAAKRLDEATVIAPVAGVIAERSVQSGDRVGDGDPLFRLVDTSELEFEATVPSEFASRVAPGAAVQLTVSGGPEGGVSGRVARVNATTDPATRQLKVYVTVPNRDRRLVGDLFASGQVVLGSASGAVAAPAAAIRADAQGASFAWVVVDGRLERRDLETGLRDAVQDRVEIRRGLAPGETVVIGPGEGLTAGQTVELAAAGS